MEQLASQPLKVFASASKEALGGAVHETPEGAGAVLVDLHQLAGPLQPGHFDAQWNRGDAIPETRCTEAG